MHCFKQDHQCGADLISGYEPDAFGHHFLALRYELRSMVELAEPPEIESVVRALIKSGCIHNEEIVDEVVSLVGDHVEERVKTTINRGEGYVWQTASEGRLKLIEASNVR